MVPFLHSKLLPIQKTLREDCTAAEVKYVDKLICRRRRIVQAGFFLVSFILQEDGFSDGLQRGLDVLCQNC